MNNHGDKIPSLNIRPETRSSRRVYVRRPAPIIESTSVHQISSSNQRSKISRQQSKVRKPDLVVETKFGGQILSSNLCSKSRSHRIFIWRPDHQIYVRKNISSLNMRSKTRSRHWINIWRPDVLSSSLCPKNRFGQWIYVQRPYLIVVHKRMCQYLGWIFNVMVIIKESRQEAFYFHVPCPFTAMPINFRSFVTLNVSFCYSDFLSVA